MVIAPAMEVKIAPKNTNRLLPTDILFQTSYWSQVKSCLGFKPVAFDIKSLQPQGDILVLVQPHGPCGKAAYVPQGPEFSPENQEDYGPYLEELSQEMIKHLGHDVSFIRYDLPWKSQYSSEIENNQRETFPEPRVREMRMNMGTKFWNLRKASMDMTVASSLIVDLKGPEDEILKKMKPKTRYNIRLAERKGVRVFRAQENMLPDFYSLYCQTASRNGFAICDYKHFLAIFNSHRDNPSNSEILFLTATHNQNLLAGAIVAISGKNALYLYGASSNDKKNFMAPYAMHWEAMRLTKDKGCRTYDMGAVSPVADQEHPFYGLYRFKTGFGGRIELRSGSWDYPLNEDKYNALINSDSLARAVGA